MHCIVGLNELKLAAIVDEVLATRAVVKVRGCGGCSGRRRLRLRRRRGHCCRRHRMLVAQRRLIFMFIFIRVNQTISTFFTSFTCLTKYSYLYSIFSRLIYTCFSAPSFLRYFPNFNCSNKFLFA